MAPTGTSKDGRERINQQMKIMLWKSLAVRRSHLFELTYELLIPLIVTSIYIYVLFRSGALPDSSSASRVPASTFPAPSFSFDPQLFSKSYILYTPNDDLTVRLMNIIETRLKIITGESAIFKNFSTPDEMLNEYLKMIAIDPNSDGNINGIIIEKDKVNQPGFTYTIRSRMPQWLKTTFCVKSNSRPCRATPYTVFSNLQVLLNLAYLTDKYPEVELNISRILTAGLVNGYRFPYPSYIDVNEPLAILAPWVLVFGFIISYVLIIKRITAEKSNQIREMYRITGLMDWIYWFVHLVDNYSIFLFQALVITGLFTIEFIKGNALVFNYSSPSLIFFIICLWGLNFSLSAMALSIPFNRPISAVVVGVLAWSLQIVPAYYIDPATNSLIDVIETRELRFLACFLPNMALTLAIRVIQQKEIYGYGATWANLFEPAPVFGELTLAKIIIILSLTTLAYIPLIYYLENVIPTQYGISKPWYFPLHSLFRFKRRKTIISEEPLIWNHDNFEPLAPSDEVKISIRNVLKEFDGQHPPAIAVNNVSFDVPHRQITMLLGENGAGKTTLMSIIIGLIPPTSGTVVIDGHNILEETVDARRNLSFCPQANVLQPELSVKGHLRLYGAIKGVPMNKLQAEVDRITEDIKLTEYKHLRPNSLSGGMRRRLNLGIALIGDSEIIILDEPTAGLDPGSRRDVWNILNAMKSRKTMIMTTHFIEEADAIGDRVAIMKKGKLACFGTPMYLKRLFGTGYELRVAKTEETSVSDLTGITTNHFPGAKLTYTVEGEVIYALPQDLSNVSPFTEFFNELEAKKDELAITSWGLGYTTLEEVFIRVVEGDETDQNSVSSDSSGRLSPTASNQMINTDNLQVNSSSNHQVDQLGVNEYLHPTVFFVTGFYLFFQRMKALIVKRLFYAKRYWRVILFQIIVPTLMFALIMVLDQKIVGTISIFKQMVQLSLQHLYGSTNALYSNPNGNAASFGEKFTQIMSREDAIVTELNGTTVESFMLEKGETLAINQYIHDYIVSMEYRDTELKIYYNLEALHALPIALNLFFDTVHLNLTRSKSHSMDTGIYSSGSPILWSTPPDSHEPLFRFSTFNYPFPSQGDLLQPILLTALRPRIWTILVQLTMPFLAASHVLVPIHERSSKSKLLQIMTGLHPALYWLAHFLFDFSIHIICTCFIFATVLVLDFQMIFHDDINIQVAFVLTLLASGIASIPLAYIFSFIFDRPSIGYSFLILLFLVFGVMMSIIDFIIESLIPNIISRSFKATLNTIVGLFPLHAMTGAIVKSFSLALEANVCNQVLPKLLALQCSTAKVDDANPTYRCCPEICEKTDSCYKYRDPLSWEYGILPGLFQLIIEAVLFTVILLILELYYDRLEWLNDFKDSLLTRFSLNTSYVDEDPRRRNIESEDTDVTAERQRVYSERNKSPPEQDILTVIDLKKTYRKFRAVEGLTFGVRQNECFGLLGINGAGKSTTFKMLVGDIYPTQGSVYICNLDITKDKRSFQQCIGYCPQYDAVIDRLTGREMLYLFGRLRGLEEKCIPVIVNQLIHDVDLQFHADKITGCYSGGNKRKLSLAMALVGSPKVVFLDEPSAGVDAANRRRMWLLLSSVRERGCCLVLTSHSMEECETLCSRIAIMVSGEFKCLGSLQHLRHKFGQGFSLYIKIKVDNISDPDYLGALRQKVESTLNAELKQHHFVNLFYHIPNKSIKWSQLFATMETIKKNFQLENFIISDTSLEQIFLAFSSKQISTN